MILTSCVLLHCLQLHVDLHSTSNTLHIQNTLQATRVTFFVLSYLHKNMVHRIQKLSWEFASYLTVRSLYVVVYSWSNTGEGMRPNSLTRPSSFTCLF